MSGRKSDRVYVVEKITELDDDMLEKLYCWVDELPLSRPKKNMARDFSDGVLVAEIVKVSFPRYVEIHNYSAANSTDKKALNWSTLNRKVLKKINMEVSPKVIKDLVDCKPFAAECVLSVLREQIDLHLVHENHMNFENQNQMLDPWMSPTSEKPEADQNRGMYPGPSAHHGSYQGLNMMNDPQSVNSHAPPPAMGAPSKPPWLGKAASQTKAAGKPGGNRSKEALPKKLLEEKEEELLVKNETIEILQAKIQRLEHLLHLKDIRIEDLTGRVDQLENQVAANSTGPGAGRGRGRSPQRNMQNGANMPQSYSSQSYAHRRR